MRRRHAMPFGAELVRGTGHFRLWAPQADVVALELSHERGRQRHTLHAEGGGWHAATISDLSENAHYIYRIDDRISVPDPASRYNPKDVHGPSALVAPLAFQWSDNTWRGRPWEDAVVYELHVGTFTPAGTFNALVERLDYLVRLGVTALELMPIADFPGKRNWGYDGVLPFAPDASYGTPGDLKRLVVAAHSRGLMVLLDVVYNHFGPEGNYLHEYAPQFFNTAHQTPWGAAINFDGPQSRNVRDFFIHNALYWIEEFNMDGLRLDAVHAIVDQGNPDFVTELATAIRTGPGRERHIHLILENDRNETRYLKRDGLHRPMFANAQWNDDLHHALHVLTTNESDGYYVDYARQPLWLLGRSLAHGFGFQGELSVHRGGNARGELSAHLPPTAFVAFTQSHDQVGNRAMGERINAIAHAPALRLSIICLLLAPAVPMLFMGEEFAASTSFMFFCDFGPELAAKVCDGRRREFAAFERFRDETARNLIPDPNAESTFLASKLKWDEVLAQGHCEWYELYSDLLELRRNLIVPHLGGRHSSARFTEDRSVLIVDWTLSDCTKLSLRANFSALSRQCAAASQSVLYASKGATPDTLPAWGGVWTLEPACG